MLILSQSHKNGERFADDSEGYKRLTDWFKDFLPVKWVEVAARRNTKFIHVGDEFGQSSWCPPPCLCLHLHPHPRVHQVPSKPRAVSGNMFSFLLSPFYERPQCISHVELFSPSLLLCLLFPVSLLQSILPCHQTASRSKYLANVLNVQLNTHALVKAVALQEKAFII